MNIVDWIKENTKDLIFFAGLGVAVGAIYYIGTNQLRNSQKPGIGFWSLW
jgi:hypothetical protein